MPAPEGHSGSPKLEAVQRWGKALASVLWDLSCWQVSSLGLGFPEAVPETRAGEQGVDLGGDSRKHKSGSGKVRQGREEDQGRVLSP